MNGPVTLLVEPERDESLRGFVLRLAERNGISSEGMCEWLALPRSRTAPSELPSAMPGQVRVERDVLIGMGLDGAERVVMLGHEVPRLLMHPQEVRVCPACLAEKCYHRHVWQLRHFENCPRHKRPLISRCSDPDCRMKLVWRRWSLRMCACGHDLASDDGLRTDDCEIEKLLLGVLGAPDFKSGIPPFDGMSLADTLDLLLFFGRLEFGIDHPDRKALARSQLSRDRRVLRSGLAVAKDWPRSFEGVAQAVRAARHDKKSLSVQYGPLHRFIERNDDRPFIGPLREAYGAHLIARGDILPGVFPEFLAPSAEAPKRWFKRPEIRELVGCLPQTFARLMKSPLARDLKPVPGAGFGQPLYRASDVMTFKQRLDRLIYARDAKRTLGLRRQDFAALVRDGVLHAIDSRFEGALMLGSVDCQAVEALQDEMRRIAVAPEPRDRLPCLELATMLERKRLGDLVTVWKAIRTGGLRAYLADCGAPGFAAVWVERDEAMTWIDRLTCVAHERWLPLADAAKALGLPQSMVGELVRLGHLPRPVREWNAQLLPREAVENLKPLFVRVAELARERGVGNRTMSAMLAPSGLTPIVPDFERVWGVPIYWRADVEAWEARREAA